MMFEDLRELIETEANGKKAISEQFAKAKSDFKELEKAYNKFIGLSLPKLPENTPAWLKSALTMALGAGGVGALADPGGFGWIISKFTGLLGL